MKTIKTQAKEALAKMLQSKKNDLDRLTKSIAAIEGNPDHTDDIRFALGLARRYGGTMGYNYISGSTLSLTVRFTVKEFKKGLVCRILTACNDLDVSSSNDYVSEYSVQRSYHFKFGTGNSLRVECNLAEDGPTCKRVIVGSETRTELIYAIEC